MNNHLSNQNLSWKEIVEHTANQVKRPDDEDFKSWMMTKEDLNNGNRLTGPKNYYVCFKIAQKINKRNNDNVSIVVGTEGTGKSTAGIQLASLISPSFCMEHICFEPDEFYSALENCKKGDSIVLDEGALFLFSRNTMTQVNRDVAQLFQLIRQKNLNIIICIPKFKNLDNNIRLNRVDQLFYVKKRGKLRCYISKGVDIINDVYPRVKSDVLSVKVPSGYWYDEDFYKPIPNINDISLESYESKKLDNFNKVLSRLKQKYRKMLLPKSDRITTMERRNAKKN